MVLHPWLGVCESDYLRTTPNVLYDVAVTSDDQAKAFKSV